MFSTSILDALATFGYVAAAGGLACCVLAYFALPKLIKIAFTDRSDDENS